MNQSSIDLIRIPIKDIFTDNDPDVDVIKVLGLAQKYLESKESLNSIPITVIQERGSNYRLIQGHEMFHALVQAGKDWVIALRIKEETGSDERWKYELDLSTIQLNICTLDANEFERTMDYFQTTIKSFSKLKVNKLVSDFANDPTRKYWSTLEILFESKSGITKSNLPLLEKYLYASPDLSELKPITPININRSSEDDILDQLQRLKIEPNTAKLRKIDSVATARKIVADDDRIYWSLSKHLIKAKTGITTALWPLIKEGFFFEPAPTPVPNRSKFLLSQLTSAKLKIEAKSRDLDPTGLLKTDLVKLLSSK